MKKVGDIFKAHRNYLIIIFVLIIVIIVLIFVNIKEEDTYVNPYLIKTSPTDNFLFLGDSITDYYALDEYYDDLPVVNSGISGNKTTDILDDMKNRVYQYNPTKVFLLIGTNDLTENSENIVSDTYKNIVKIIENIKENRSKAKIYLESIYPINEMVGDIYEDKSANIIELNEKLEEYCNDSSNCTYVDIYSSLADDDNKLKEKYSDDGLHLNSLGYVVVTRELLPYLND